MFYSILVVCLNPGDKLKRTMDSILQQSFQDYEIVIKDGGSTDGTVSAYENVDSRIRIVNSSDSGIYDAMNQAVVEAKGTYLYFLNCGDYFYDSQVLFHMAAFIEAHKEKQGIYYGNIYERLTKQVVCSNPHMDAFGCYRNVPCHQACFYNHTLFKEHTYQTGYQVRADYEHFLWCFFKGHAVTHFVELIVADYEGGGYSEEKKNRKVSKQEHHVITKQYMGAAKCILYRLTLILTLSGLRTFLAGNVKTAACYNRLKKMLYRR